MSRCVEHAHTLYDLQKHTHNNSGVVTGVQGSVQSLCEILSFLAGCALHKPEQFGVLMAGSLAAVGAAAALYFSAGALRRARGYAPLL